MGALDEIAAYDECPFTPDETALAQIADWGRAEDWSAWIAPSD